MRLVADNVMLDLNQNLNTSTVLSKFIAIIGYK